MTNQEIPRDAHINAFVCLVDSFISSDTSPRDEL